MPDMQQLGPNTWASTTAVTSNDFAATSSSSPTAASSSHLLPQSSLQQGPPSDADDLRTNPSSIPPWVHVDASETSPFLFPPSPIRPNTRHYKPPPSGHGNGSSSGSSPHNHQKGRRLDHLRSSEPALIGAPIAERQLEWESFMRSGPQPVEFRPTTTHHSAGGVMIGRRADSAWIETHMPLATRGWREEDDMDPEAARYGGLGRGGGGYFKGVMYKGKWLISPERQERTVKLFWRLLLKNAFVPLVFRITTLAFSTAALGIGTTIFQNVRHANHDADPNNQCDPKASTYMAIVVGTVTIPYSLYVTWDEYTSKPLGLRSVAAKTLLLLCDLYFIVFSASNVSLAFDALLDASWACYDREDTQLQTCPNNPDICYKQRALSGVLIVSLLAWLLCFSISVLRVVEKLRPE